MLSRQPSENKNAPAASAAALAVSDEEARTLFADLAPLAGILLAVSGGPDSTALMLLATRWREALCNGPRLFAVSVDHGLRAEAAQEALSVKHLAHRLGIEHCTMRWVGPKPTSGVQEAARAHRYRLLANAARSQKIRHILTAHTRDDQAETVLFRLIRGSGVAGLAGMARVTAFADFVLVRPFLELPKCRLIATLEAAGLSYTKDPSNENPRFFRARLRTVMPLLSAQGLDPGRLAVLARRMARAHQALEAAAQEAYARLLAVTPGESGEIALDRRGLFELPEEIALRVLRRAIAATATRHEVELAKLEALWVALCFAETGPQAKPRTRRTLGGAIITVAGDMVRLKPAPPRRRVLADRRLPRTVKGPFIAAG
jgi:tRNA(Ile)-lysidine synthase